MLQTGITYKCIPVTKYLLSYKQNQTGNVLIHVDIECKHGSPLDVCIQCLSISD